MVAAAQRHSIQDRWRIDDEWWRERPISRLYYSLLLEDESLVTLYHDLINDKWFEQRGRRSRIELPDERKASLCPENGASAYVELHLHSCYSFLAGASRPQEIVESRPGARLWRSCPH